MRTSEEIELWKSSPVFITRKKEYEKDGEELFQYAEQYIKKQEELEQKCRKTVKSYQYCIGETNMHRGALCPSKIEDVFVGNTKRGRLVKNVNKKQPEYIYYFDEYGRLLKAETTKEYSEYNHLEEYIIYEGNCEIGITYEDGKISRVSKVIMENGLLKLYQCEAINWWSDGVSWELKSEKYHYETKGFVKVDDVDLDGNYLSYYQIKIKINDQGQALSYTSNEIIGEKVFEDDYVREIKKKIFFFDEPQNDTTKPSDSNKLTQTPEDSKKELTNANIINCLCTRIKSIMETWNEDEEIYAVSFFVQAGGEGEVPSFVISYNTEEYCKGAPENDEERWNYACWSQDEVNVIGGQEEKVLKEWYESQGISEEALGYGDLESNDNEDGTGTEKGAKGLYELVQILPDVAKKLKKEKVVAHCCKKDVPIIIHDLEYTWYMVEATKKANPGKDLSGFLEAVGY